MTITKTWGLIAILLVFAALALAGTMDAKDVESSHQQYCEMVALWDTESARGVAPEQRKGWPPFDGRDKCNKEQ